MSHTETHKNIFYPIIIFLAAIFLICSHMDGTCASTSWKDYGKTTHPVWQGCYRNLTYSGTETTYTVSCTFGIKSVGTLKSKKKYTGTMLYSLSSTLGTSNGTGSKYYKFKKYGKNTGERVTLGTKKVVFKKKASAYTANVTIKITYKGGSSDKKTIKVKVPALSKYTVVWNANGGSVSPASSTGTYGTSVVVPTPVRSGYIFKGWDSTPATYTKNMTCKAIWIATDRTNFLNKLDYHSRNLFKAYPGLIVKQNTPTTNNSATAYKNAKAGSKVYVNCHTCIDWALQDIGILTQNTCIYGKASGGFSISSTNKTNVLKHGSIITSGSVIKLSLKQAADQGLIEAGDIIAVAITGSTENNLGGTNHTCVYAGMSDGKYYFYESGGNAANRGYKTIGCGPFYYTSSWLNNYHVAGIIRLNNN